MTTQPGDRSARTQQQLCTPRTPRVVAARRLTRRSRRDETRLFLAEGPQAVREAGAAVRELFVTPDAGARYPELVRAAELAGARISWADEAALAALSETVQPQGIVAVCAFIDRSLADVLGDSDFAPSSVTPLLAAVLVSANDPGNAGTILRTADAAGADAVVFSSESVDPYAGKCVRATAGSLFHPVVVRGGDALEIVARLRDAGVRVLATTGGGDTDLFAEEAAGRLAGPTAWLFGNEAHGLPPEIVAAADVRLAVPIFGRAESLNLAAAATVCLYASARAHSRLQS